MLVFPVQEQLLSINATYHFLLFSLRFFCETVLEHAKLLIISIHCSIGIVSNISELLPYC